MQYAMGKKNSINRILNWHCGFSIFLISMLFFIVVYHTLIGANSNLQSSIVIIMDF
jgi:hypothetical protein